MLHPAVPVRGLVPPLRADEKRRAARGDTGYPGRASGLLCLLPKGTAVIQGTAVCRFSKARKENCRLCEK